MGQARNGGMAAVLGFDSGAHRGNPAGVETRKLSLRDEMMMQYRYERPIRVGAAGGIGTSAAAAAAFVMGANFGSGANGEFPLRIQCYFGELGAGMSNGKGTKAMFAGRHFDREVIPVVRTLVPSLQAQPSGSCRDDGRTWTGACSYDHHALGPTLCPGVRKELGSLC